MAGTYEKIATTTLSSNQGTVTFSSIPQTYTDLRVIIKGGIVDGGFFIGIFIPNDGLRNYWRVPVAQPGSRQKTPSLYCRRGVVNFDIG